MPRAISRESSDEEMEDAPQTARKNAPPAKNGASGNAKGKGKARQPIEEEEEEDELEEENEEEEDSDEEVEGSQDEDENLRYDPDQKVEDKRRVRAQYRELLGEQDEHRSGNAKLTIGEILANQRKADSYFKQGESLVVYTSIKLMNYYAICPQTTVKAPQEATLDSKVMLQNAEMGAAMARAMKHDIEAFDVDDYIAKLITYMGGRGNPLALGANGAVNGDVENDAADDTAALEDDGVPLAWEKIGKRAFGWSRRAASMDFMVGPLSIQIKERKKAATRARLRKDARQEIQPAQLQAGDIQRSENETTKMVTAISAVLNRTGDDGVTLFEFVVDPKSFAQSVENLFYVSFLVKEGKAAVYPKELEGGGEGVLMLYPSLPPGEDEAGREAKKQQVFTLTPDVWRGAIELFQIKKSLYIPHRERPAEFDAEIKNPQFLA